MLLGRNGRRKRRQKNTLNKENEKISPWAKNTFDVYSVVLIKLE
jgi:hypothetical protein